MTKNNLFTVVFLLIINSLYAQEPLVEYSFTGCSGCNKFSTDNALMFGSVSEIQQKNVTVASISNKFRAKNWSTSPTIDLSKYYFFKISPDTDYLMNLSKIELDEARSASGIWHWCVRSNLDNFTSNLAFFSVPDNSITRKNQVIDLDASFQNLDEEIEFRFYAYEAESTSGNWTIDNLKIYGEIPDIAAPELLQVTGQNTNQLKFTFSENITHTLALNSNNYGFSPNLKIKKINFQYQDNQVVIITFENNLVPNTNYQCTVKNMADEVGNILNTATQNILFTDNSPPEVSNIIVNSAHAIDIFFDENVDKSSAENTSNYQVFDKDNSAYASPISAILSPENPQKATLFFDQSFEKNDDYELHISNVEDVAGNQNLLNKNYFRLDTKKPKVEVAKVISDTQLELYFSEIIDPVYAQVYNNYLVDNEIGIPSKITLISDKKVQLTFQEKLKENQEYCLKVSNLRDLQNNIMSSQSISFYYDIQSPKITRIEIVSNSQMRIIFDESLDEITAENLENYRIIALNQTPIKAELNPFFPNIVTLTFSPITLTNDVELAISGVQDINQNTLQNNDNQIVNFSNPHLYWVNVLAKDKISLHFSQALQATSAENISSYAISQGIGTPQNISLYASDFTTVIIELATDLELSEKYNIYISELTDTDGDRNENLNYEFSYQNYVETVYPTSENLLNITFRYPPIKSEAENTTMYEIEGFSTPLLAFQDLENPNLVHLQFTSVFESNKNYNLKINNLNLLSGHIIPLQTHTFAYDSRPPHLESVTVVSNDELLVKFSEPVSDEVEEALSFFEVDQGISYPEEIERDKENQYLVSLKFTKLFQPTTRYILSVNHIEDLQQNRMKEEQKITFQRPIQPQKQEIIFNEIFADPEPPVDLPPYEFLELYNKSSTTYDLGGFQLSDGNSSKTLTSFELRAGEFVILCSQEAKAEYEKYGNVLALDSWLSLTNSGKTLMLKDWDGNIIDSLKYSDSWYKDAEKKSGGWSLEKIDYQADCNDSEIWEASQDSTGGTPAQRNSIYKIYSDSLASEIEKVEITETNKIQLQFSEPAQKSALNNIKNYRLEPRLSIQELTILDTQTIEITLTQEIDSSSIYTIYTKNLIDCAGNIKNDTVRFAIGQRALKNEIIISEIMPKESEFDSLQRAEYIEIYNRSNKLISLKSIIFTDATSQVNLPDYFLQPNEYLVLTASQNTAFFTHALAVPSFPSLNNSGEKLTLQDTSGYEIFLVTYSDSLLKKIENYEGGYSLEIKNINQPNIADNWLVSGNSTGGTPGQGNQPTEIIEEKEADETNPTEPEEKLSEIESVQIVNNRIIDVIFSGKLTQSIKNTITVQIENTSLRTDLSFLDTIKLRITLNQSLGFTTVYRLRISYGNGGLEENQKLYYFNIAISKYNLQNALFITEIMANESPIVGLPDTEYIELYNRSDSIIDLSKVQFEDERTSVILPQSYLLPKSYAIICPKNKATEFNILDALGVSNFPSLNNSGERLQLKNIQNQEIIFSLHYDNSWYQDDEKDNGGWALEMVNLESLCQGKNNWRASENASGGTPAQPNSLSLDSNLWKPAILVEVFALNDTTLYLKFDSDLDTNAVELANFSLSDNIQIQGFEIISLNELLIITNKLSVNKKYIFETKNIQNCNGLISESQTFEFLFGVKPDYQELKITEMMLDPVPAVNLPEIEYFELHNPTDKIISLADISVTNRQDTAQFSVYYLAPNDYLLICDENHFQDFQNQFPDIKILGVDDLFSLKNTNSNLTLFTDTKVIFSVDYRTDFYKHPEKDFGGWSLEMRDVHYNCASSRNWEASQNENGGTPAMPNSVTTEIEDYHVPNLLKVETLSSDSILLFFDQELYFSKANNFEIKIENTPYVSIKSMVEYDNSSLLIVFTESLKISTVYTLSVRNIYGCNGKVQLEKQSKTFRLPEKAIQGDILLNEILFNPPVGGTDFIELYNNSYKYINLKNWFIANDSDTNRITLENYLIAPSEYVILTESIEKFKNFYPTVEESKIIEMNLPSMPDDEGSIIILNPDKMQMDKLDYSEDWHSDLLSHVEGISLERIFVDVETNIYTNWTSSAFPNHATPAQINSQVQSPNNTNINECISFNTQSISPNQDGFDDFLLIDFNCLPAGTIGNIDIYDASGRKIYELIQNQLLSNQNQLRWDGVDANNHKVRAGYFILYFELFDDVGNLQRIRKKIVVTNPLD